MRLGFLVPLGFAIGAAICAWMLRAAPQAVHADLSQPLAVVTYWQQFGARVWLALAIAVGISSIGYVSVLRRCDAGVGVTLALSAFACAAALLFPVVFSSDVYAYAGYGDMVLHGINPYAHARIAVRDPLLDAMQWQWGNPPPMCVYGPAFVWIARVIVTAALPLGAAAPLWAMRVLACVALIACAPLAYAAFARFPRATRLAAAAGIALNPIAIWSAAEGHNDPLALAVVLAGFALLARGARFTGALIATLSALIKAPGAFAALALCACCWGDRTRFARVASGTGLGIAIVLALCLPLEYGVRAHLGPSGHYFPQFSLQDVSIPIAFITIAALVWTSRFNLAAISLAAFLAIPNPYPWYAVWLLPLAFLTWRSAAAWALVACSLLMTLRYYAEATSALPAYGHAAIVGLQFGIPLLIMAWHIWNARPDRPEIRMPVPGFAPRHSA